MLAAAKQHFEAGRAAYNVGNYPTAIREFKAAEALRPSPILAYNIGLANDRLGRRRVAVRYYRRYLEGAPTAPNRAEVEGRIAQLDQEIAAQPQAQPAEQPGENPPPPPVATAPADPNSPPTVQAQPDPYAGQGAPVMTAPPRKKRNLWWVWLLVGIGSAAVVTAIVLAVIYGMRANDTYYYYSQPVPTARLSEPAINLGGRSALPATQRSAETVPLLQFRF